MERYLVEAQSLINFKSNVDNQYGNVRYTDYQEISRLKSGDFEKSRKFLEEARDYAKNTEQNHVAEQSWQGMLDKLNALGASWKNGSLQINKHAQENYDKTADLTKAKLTELLGQAKNPSAPSTQGAKPADAPAKPADAPAKPADAPAKPADAPAKPADAPAKPADAPAKPAETKSRISGGIEFVDGVTENADLKDKKMFVIATRANVRGENAKVVTTLDKGQEVVLTGKVNKTKSWMDFYEVTYGDGKTGWMSSKVINEKKDEKYVPLVTPTPKTGGGKDGEKKDGEKKDGEKKDDNRDRNDRLGESAVSNIQKTVQDFNTYLSESRIPWVTQKSGIAEWKTPAFNIRLWSDGNVYPVKDSTNEKVGVSENDIALLDQLSAIAKKNWLNGEIKLPEGGIDWFKTGLLGLGATALGILGWKQLGKKSLQQTIKKWSQEIEEHILTSRAVVQATEDALKQSERKVAKKWATQADKDALITAKEDVKNAKEALEQAVQKMTGGKKYTKAEIKDIQSSVKDMEDMSALAQKDLDIARKNATKKWATQADREVLKVAEDSANAANESLIIAKETLENAQKNVIKDASVIGKNIPSKTPVKTDNVVEFSKRPMNANDIRAVQRNMVKDTNYKPEFIAQDGSIWQIQEITGKNANDTLIKIAAKAKPNDFHSVNQKDFIAWWNLNAKNIPAINLPPSPTKASALKNIQEWVKNNPVKTAIGTVMIGGIVYNWTSTDTGKIDIAPAPTTWVREPFTTWNREDTLTGTRNDLSSTGTRTDSSTWTRN
jgi:hypothetical protein